MESYNFKGALSMKKITLGFIIIISFVFLLTGCGLLGQTAALSKTTTVRNDLNNYIDLVNKFNDNLNELLLLSAKEFANEPDNNIALKNLKNDIIPKFEKFLQDVKSANIKTEEVKKLHAEYINAVEFQLQNYKDYQKALETNDETLLKKAEDESVGINSKMENHWNNLKKLCSDYKVLIFDAPSKTLK